MYAHTDRLAEVGVGSLGEVQGAQLLGGRAQHARGQRELDVALVVLRRGHALAVTGLHGRGADDLNRAEAAAVAASHVVVQIVDSIVEVGVSVLAVHIVSAAAGVILYPDAEVLNVSGLLLRDLKSESSGKRIENKKHQLICYLPRSHQEFRRWSSSSSSSGA